MPEKQPADYHDDDVPAWAVPLGESIARHWPVRHVDLRRRRGHSRGRMTRGVRVIVRGSDTAEGVLLACVETVEDWVVELGPIVVHADVFPRAEDAEHETVRMRPMVDDASEDVTQAALRFARHCELTAQRAMGYLQQTLQLQAEMSAAMSRAMKPQVALRRLELEAELARREQEAQAESRAAGLAVLERLGPALLAYLQRAAGPADQPSG